MATDRPRVAPWGRSRPRCHRLVWRRLPTDSRAGSVSDLRRKLRRPRSAESCPDPCPDRPAERHRVCSVTSTQEAPQLACGAARNGVCVGGGPAITHSIVERHAHASSLGAPRRPVRAAGLTRVRLAPVWPLRDGRHHAGRRRLQFDARLGLAASDDHPVDSGETGVAAMTRSTNGRTSGSVCAERPAHSRSSGGVHVRNLVALLIQASDERATDLPPLKLRRPPEPWRRRRSGLRTLYQ